VAIVAVRGIGRIVSCMFFVRCPTTLSLVVWVIVAVLVVMALYANRSG
jgi:hypothetical protein